MTTKLHRAGLLARKTIAVALAAALALPSAHGATRAWTYTYDTSGILEATDGPRTDVADETEFTYDASGHLIQMTDAGGLNTAFSDFDSYGNPRTITDPNGVETTLTYTPQGWLATSTVDGKTTTFTHDAIGQITKVTRGDGSFLEYTWNSARRLVAVQNNLGERMEYAYDAMGNRTGELIKDAAAATTRSHTWIYDELGRLLQTVGAASQVRSFAYDKNDNSTWETTPRAHGFARTFDALNRLVTSTDPLSGTTTMGYDAQDNLVSVEDPRGVTTTYVYDGLGNLTQQVSPDSGTTAFVHDAAGNVIQRTDARGVVTDFTYDALNRLTAREFPTAPGLDAAFGYDSVAGGNQGKGRLTSISDASGSLAYTYDASGNLTAQTRSLAVNGTPRTDALGYAYDSANRLATLTYPDAATVTYARNSAGQVTAIDLTLGTNPSTPLVSAINYLPFGAVKSLTWGNGLALNRVFDQDYRLAQQTIGTGTWQTALTYDANSNITQIDSSLWGVADHSFDELDRLTQEARASQADDYSYDAVGNRTRWDSTPITGGVPGSTVSTDYTYGSTNNRLTAIGLQAVTSDAAGNLAQDRANRQYTHDAQGRLSTVLINSAQVAEFTYNALGQRTHKLTANGTTTYLYSPSGQLLGETQYDFSGNKVKSQYFVWLDEMPVALVDVAYDALGAVASTNPLYLHADHLNTPRLATKHSQTVVWQLPSTGAFGTAQALTDPDADSTHVVINLRFPGQMHDLETGLNYNYYRDYDPETGRYVQSDPIGLEGGLNTYGYVAANPVRYTDPKGLVNPVGGAMAGGTAGSALGPVGTVVGALIGAGVGGLIGWYITGPMLQDKTPNEGEPGSWHTNPGSGQERLYGPDGRPAIDIDWDHDHQNDDGTSAGTPHGHNWDWSQKPPRSFPVPISPWPRGRTCPAD